MRIQISPAPNPVANVWVSFGYSSPLVFTQMISNAALPTISTSQQLMIGYAASTGGSTNYHEIRNLLVSNQNTTSAIDLAITKTFTDVTTGSTTTASVGDQIRYTVVASNTGPNNVTATGVGIVDTVPAAITGVNWTCAGSGGATCAAASGSGNNINTTANLPRYGYVTYTITGTLGTGAPSLLTNTASLVIPGSVTDYNSSDDSATVSSLVRCTCGEQHDDTNYHGPAYVSDKRRRYPRDSLGIGQLHSEYHDKYGSGVQFIARRRFQDLSQRRPMDTHSCEYVRRRENDLDISAERKSRSGRYFPDSPSVRECHQRRQCYCL